jgi:hypothetical protein
MPPDQRTVDLTPVPLKLLRRKIGPATETVDDLDHVDPAAGAFAGCRLE